MDPMLAAAVLLAASYLSGSVSFAWFAGKLTGRDLRKEGSGNLGATNAGRVLGAKWFAFVFIGDLLKGALPVLAASLLLGRAMQAGADIHLLRWLPLSAAAAAVLGHIFTCFHGFKGGKAVATTLGVLIGLAPVTAGLTFAAWLLAWCLGWIVFRLKRSDAVGPASMLAALAAVPLHCSFGRRPEMEPALTVFLTVLALVILWRHRSNLRKLLGKPA